MENFLLDFPGCLVVVTHDRYFMDKIVDHLFVFKGNAEVQDFPGNYSDYREYEALEASEANAKPAEVSKETTAQKKSNNENSGLTYNEQKEFKKLEKEIPNLEKQKEKIQAKFLEELSGEEIDKTSLELQKVLDEIEAKTERYFELGEKES